MCKHATDLPMRYPVAQHLVVQRWWWIRIYIIKNTEARNLQGWLFSTYRPVHNYVTPRASVMVHMWHKQKGQSSEEGLDCAIAIYRKAAGTCKVAVPSEGLGAGRASVCLLMVKLCRLKWYCTNASCRVRYCRLKGYRVDVRIVTS